MWSIPLAKGFCFGWCSLGDGMDVEAIGDHIDFVVGRAEKVMNFTAHILATDNHTPGFVTNAPLHLVDQIADVARNIALMAAPLSGMDGSQEWRFPKVFQGNPCLAHQPIVNMDQIVGVLCA